MSLHRRHILSLTSKLPLSRYLPTPVQRLTSPIPHNISGAISRSSLTVPIRSFNTLHRNYNSQSEADPKPWQKFRSAAGDEYSDPNPWVPHSAATRYANELLTAPEDDIGEGVRIIKMNNYLQNNEEESPDIFSRTDSRAVWDTVYQVTQTAKKKHAVVTGNPGVGKSRSMAYFLRRLLHEGKTVVYEARKDDTWFLFVPTEEKITVTTGEKKEFAKYEVYSVLAEEFKRAGCTALMNPDNYRLIDPDDPQQKTSPSAAHTIVAASPDKRHFHEFSKQARKFFIPLWSFSELNVMRQHMLVKMATDTQKAQYRTLTSDEFTHRFTMVGGRPRYLFGDVDFYDDFVADIDTDIETLGDTALIEAMNPRASIGASQSGELKVSSKLFAYFLDFSANRPYSYPGSAKLGIASDYVRLRLVVKYHNHLMNVLNPNSPHYVHSVTHLVRAKVWEAWALSVLQAGGTFVRKSLGSSDEPEESSLVLDKVDSKYIHDTATVPEFLKAVKELRSRTETRHFITGCQNLPVVDAMDLWDRGFQVTTNVRHGIKGEPMLEMVNAVGYTKENPLHLYFVVPGYDDEKDIFARMKNNQGFGQHKEGKFLNSVVKQYALKIPVSPSPEATEGLLHNVKDYISMLKKMQSVFEKTDARRAQR